jgi:Cdc6-like AAA superfamily ATPase
MTAPATTRLPARRVAKQLADARRAADLLCAAVEGVQRVGIATHRDGSVTVALRIATSAGPGSP